MKTMNNVIQFRNIISYRTVMIGLFLCTFFSLINAQTHSMDVLIDSLELKYVPELYCETPEDKVISSISVMNNDQIEKNSVMSFGNILYGRIPGLHVVQANGEMGNDYPQFYVRGQHSILGSNSPLILVDGIPRDLNTLTVSEVESVSVLKDAASTALYGMDGANGVILVTTKRGLKGKTSIGFKAEFGLQSPTRLPEFYGSYDYANFYTMAEKNDGKSNYTYTQEKLDGYKNNLDNILYPNVNWIDESIRNNSPMQNYVLDLTGGNNIARFYVNLGYGKSEGIFKEIGNKTYNANNSIDRINFRSNIDINITKAFSMSVDLSGRLENLNSPYNSSASIWTNLYTFHPNAAPIYSGIGIWGGSNTYTKNPIAYINDMGYRRTHRRLLQSNIQLNYDLSALVENLSIGARAAFDNYYSVDNGYSKTFSVRQPIEYDPFSDSYVLGETIGINSNLASFGPSNENEITSTTFDIFSKYHNNFRNNSLSCMILFHADSKESYLSSADLSSSPDRRISFGGKISYGFKERYLIDLAASYAGGENFIRGRRFGFYPSIAVGWLISKEQFLNSNKAITNLKLRASTGLVGNQNIGGTLFGYRNLYTAASGSWGAGPNNSGISSGYKEAAIGNEFLTWEKAYKTDAGLDVSFWNQLHFMFNYFYEYRYDLLNSGNELIPSFLGSTFGYINYAKVASYGFESTVSWIKQFQNDLSFNTGFSVSKQNNKILRKKESSQLYDYLYTQGYPIGQRFGLICEGYYSEEDITERNITQTFGAVIPGSLKYKDINEDGVINSDDRVAIGKSSIPEWELGLNLGVNYKGIYLDLNLQACLGRDVDLRSAAPYATSPLYYDRNVSTFINQPWTAEYANNPALSGEIDFPSLTIENGTNNFQTSTFFLRNGNFLRLRSLEVGYQFPFKKINKLFLKDLRLYFRGMNLLTFDHLNGFFDPEVLEGYPVLKSYNLGVNITF